MKNAMSLKARIRNLARQKNIPAQVILQNLMFERLLVRQANRLAKMEQVSREDLMLLTAEDVQALTD